MVYPKGFPKLFGYSSIAIAPFAFIINPADKSFDTIPLYLRPDHAVPLFDEAPLHIGEKNFSGYDLILNLTDRLEQHFYDDGFDGSVRAVIADGIVTVETDLPVRKLRVYSDQPIREIRRQG